MVKISKDPAQLNIYKKSENRSEIIDGIRTKPAQDIKFISRQ